MGYFFYYPMIILVTMFYFIYRFELFEKLSFVLVTCFFVYYIVFILVPCAGPQFYFPVIGYDSVAQGVFPPIGDYFDHNIELVPAPDYEQGFFHNLVKLTQKVGERPTAAFPSSHVAISTILMIMAWRAKIGIFFFLIPCYVCPCLATVYIQAHYLIDTIVGFVSAFPFYVGVIKMFMKRFAVPMFKSTV